MHIYINFSEAELKKFSKDFIKFKLKDYNKCGIHLTRRTLITHLIIELAKKPVVKKCKNKCFSKRTHYEIPPAFRKNLIAMAENEGTTLAKMLDRKIIYPLLQEAENFKAADF